MINIVYVATIETYYEVMAVAGTEAEARELACKQAVKYLRKAGALTSENNTPAKIADWFGVTVTRVPVGTAVYVNNEIV